MARIASQVKCGFYPCPLPAIDHIVQYLQPPTKGRFSILDPCCGKGEAIRHLAAHLSCPDEEVYAIELDERRAEEAKANLPDSRVVGPASFYGVFCPVKSLSFIWCNPPFDGELGSEGERTEARFLEHATSLLVPHGIMALVCPENVARGYGTMQYLNTWYDDVSIVPFPAEHRKFKEVVVFGVKRDKVKAYWGDAMSKLFIAPKTYLIPPCVGPGSRFIKTTMTDAELEQSFSSSPLMKMLAPPPERRLPSPPLQLGIGHLAMMLSAGQLDGLVQPPGEPPHVVRGTARKVEEVKSKDSEVNDDGSVTTKVVLSEKIVLTVRAVGVDGCIKTFSQE